MEIANKINLFAPRPKGSKLIFFAAFRVGVNEENQYSLIYFNNI